MSDLTWNENKMASVSTGGESITHATHPSTARVETPRLSRTSFIFASLSFLIYGLSVSRAVTNLCNHEVMSGYLSAQACQYTAIMFSGMLMGLSVGPWLESGVHKVLHLVGGPDDTRDSQHIQRMSLRVSGAVLVLCSAVNVLVLLARLNAFVDLHAGFKDAVVLLAYGMGALSGGAWYMVLHRLAGFGVLLSCAMSLMMAGSVLSIHSWP